MNNALEAQPTESVSVEIYDQIYHLRGSDPEYIARLARLVDDKMRAVSANGGTVDSLRVAVLASLNIADELECLRASIKQSRSRSASLSGMLDQMLGEVDEPKVRRAG